MAGSKDNAMPGQPENEERQRGQVSGGRRRLKDVYTRSSGAKTVGMQGMLICEERGVESQTVGVGVAGEEAAASPQP